MKDEDLGYLAEWRNKSSSEIAELWSQENKELLKGFIDYLGDDSYQEIEVTEINFEVLIREMGALLKKGSNDLGKAIVKSASLEKSGKVESAIKVFEDFITSCPSKFYRNIAQNHLRKLR